MGEVLVGPYQYRRDPKLLWRGEWEVPHESPWGLLQRLRVANVTTSWDLIDVIGFEVWRGYSNSIRAKHLTSLGVFDARLLTKMLGYSFHDNVEAFYNRYCRIFLDDKYSTKPLNDCFKGELSICPSCMVNGLHSLFHQLSWLHRCVFHDEPLVQHCPNCGRPMLYGVERKKHEPFGCVCGFSWTTHRDFSFLLTWSNLKLMDIKEPATKRWSSWGRRELELASRIYVNVQTMSYNSHKALISYMDFLTTTQNDTGIKPTGITHAPHYGIITINLRRQKLYFATRRELEKNFVFMRGGTRFETSNPEIRDEQFGAHMGNNLYFRNYVYRCFKSVAKYIKNTYLRNHRHCLNHYIRPRPNASPAICEPTCNVVLAYVRWRQEIECLDDFTQVENAAKKKWRRVQPLLSLEYNEVIQHFLSSDLFRQLRVDLGDKSAEIVDAPVDVFRVYTRILSRFLVNFYLSRFFQWFHLISNDSRLSSEYQSRPALVALSVKSPTIFAALSHADAKHGLALDVIWPIESHQNRPATITKTVNIHSEKFTVPEASLIWGVSRYKIILALKKKLLDECDAASSLGKKYINRDDLERALGNSRLL